MAFLYKTDVLISGKEIDAFREIYLHQKIHAHQFLEIKFPKKALEEEDTDFGQQSKDLLGETISIQVTDVNEHDHISPLVFEGIITGVKLSKGEMSHAGDEIILKAASQEIISDDGPNYGCFHQMTLDKIVKKVMQDYGFKLQVSSTFTETLEYVVQHNESAFEFIQRLAEQYGQWFYYNGEELVFGKPETNETELKYGFDLKDYEVHLTPRAQSFNYFSHDYLKDKMQTDDKPHKPGLSGYNSTVYKKSDHIFKNKTNVWINTNSEEKAAEILKHKAKVQQENYAINQSHLTGGSENSGIKLGNLVSIQKEGKYRITEVSHHFDYSGHYENHFVGVAGDQDGYPHTNINAFPLSQSQIAHVIDTNDPDGLGRIKVEFGWQSLIGEVSPWIRVLTPSAGEGQGIQFLPEVGDEVLVDFEGGDAESPYVVGALHHQGKKPGGDWGSSGNDIKIIHTRGGHKITFKDKDGDESITIEDKEGNSILLDTKEKGISINAAQNLTINAGADISITAGGKLTMDSGTDMVHTAGTKLESKAGTEMAMSAGAKAELKAPMIGIKADASAKLEAPMVDIDGKAMTNVKGALLNLNCT